MTLKNIPMNAIKYFYNRFSYAIKTNGTIKVNQQDIEAVNKLVEFEKKRNTDLEDALMLYYIFLMYRVENENNMAKIKEKGAENVNYPLGINTPYSVLEKLSKMIDPKPYVIKKIHEELWIYQEYERVCKNQELYKSEMYENQEWIEKGDISYLKITPQEKIPIPKEEFITYEEVESLINETLSKAKEDFSMIKALSKGVKWKS